MSRTRDHSSKGQDESALESVVDVVADTISDWLGLFDIFDVACINPHGLRDGCPPPTLCEVHPELIKYEGVYGSCTEGAMKFWENDMQFYPKPTPLAFKEAAQNPDLNEKLSLAADYVHKIDLPGLGS